MSEAAPPPPEADALDAPLLGVHHGHGDLAAADDDGLTLSFENLSVHVPGVAAKWYHRLLGPFKHAAQEHLGLSTRSRGPLRALANVTGVLAPGELCLVLGSDDGAKSTLLRALAGRLSAQDERSGTLALNGAPLTAGSGERGWRRLCPYVGPSDTDHAPELTVRETLEFARRCTAPDATPAEAIAKDVRDLMVHLGLDHVAGTVVGDENLRGVSGGQKRRVTVGEMLLDKSCEFICLENITDGLSSTDSVHLIQGLAKACHKGGLSACVSLLQPSDEMVKLFDKLLVLSGEGELLYFGPVDRPLLRDVFLDSASDSLAAAEDAADAEGGGDGRDKGSIADLVLAASLDKTGAAEGRIRERYRASAAARDVEGEVARLRATARRDAAELLASKEEYPNSFAYRFQLVCSRRVTLIKRNAVTWTRVLIALMFGLIIGSLFAYSPNTAVGALTKNGYIFLHCFIVLMLSAAVTLPSCFRERTTLFKHRSAEFYDMGSSYLAMLLTDAPLSILEACLLAVVSYFWVGMRKDAASFFYFLSMLIALEFTGQALGRLLCAVYRKQVTANSASSIIILVFGTMGGFMPSFGTITPVLRWLSWLTPVSYAFEGLMLNEFTDLDFTSSLMGAAGGDNGTVPINFGGNTWLGMYDLPRNDFARVPSMKTFDIFMVFFFAVLYDVLGFRYMEKTRAFYHNQIRRPQSTVMKSFGMGGGSDKKASTGAAADDEGASSWPSSLIGRNIVYEVPVRKGGKGRNGENSIRLLDEVNVHFRRGKMTCLMGTSGAGKTTLLDVMAGYKTGGTITGDILIDGRAKDPATWKKISGYAEQQDILNPYLSVLETLRFTANCRLPKDTNKDRVIQKVIRLMDLEDWSDHVIGREKDGEGLPKHARKRVTIAVELVALPKILFLDEPTTGLGTNAAALVMNAVRQATNAMGLITVATIHQPSCTIFEAFDDVLLLTKGGRMTYMGSSSTLLNHFEHLTEKHLPKQCNPADFCLSVLDGMMPDAARSAFDTSDLNTTLVKNIENEMEKGRSSTPPSITRERPNNALTEIWLLTKRDIIVQWRNPSYCFMRITSSIVMSLFLGILFFGDKSVLSGAVFSIGAIFFLVFVLVIPMQATVVPLVEDRAVLYRETVSGCYSRTSYCIGQLIADQPFHMVNSLLMFICFYFLVGFKMGGEEIGYFILMVSMGQLYSVATPNEESANGLGGLSVMLSVILMGFLINYASMPGGWQWAYWANLFHYILQGLVTNELAGSDYHLDVGEILEGINVDQMFYFDADNVTQSQQLSSILSLVSEIPDGTNPDSSKLPSLIDCTITNGCFSEEGGKLSAGFMDCYLFGDLFSDPPCSEEYKAVLESVDVIEVGKCFINSDEQLTEILSPVPLMDPLKMHFGETISFQSQQPFAAKLPGQTPDASISENDDLTTVLCLAGALLPENAKERIMNIVFDLFGIAGFVVDVIDKGIYIPGDIILYVFGWAEFNDSGFAAPYKWYYCMFSVVMFLIAIEISKLVSLRFIVWTKR